MSPPIRHFVQLQVAWTLVNRQNGCLEFPLVGPSHEEPCSLHALPASVAISAKQHPMNYQVSQGDWKALISYLSS